MSDPNALLRGDQSAGHRRIDVAVHDYPIGAVAVEYGLEPEHDAGGLLRMSSGADAEVLVRLGEFKVVEKAVAHCGVVVLSRGHQGLLEPAGPAPTTWRSDVIAWQRPR